MKWDDKGLAVAIAQNVDTGAVLMQGFVNRDALATTISSQKATFYSRSRSKLWTKGETSLNFINIHDIFLDCDRDSVCFFLLLFSWMHKWADPLSLDLTLNHFSDNIPWEAWWAYLPHWIWNLLLFISIWFVKKSSGLYSFLLWYSFCFVFL